MPNKVLSSALVGIEAVPISVQIDSSPGLHSFTIVGLGDKAVQESIDRIDAAIKHSGFTPPRSKNKRFIVNLAPADLKKEGPGYDLPIAIAYLVETGQITADCRGILCVGELGLDGLLSHTNGVLATTLLARESGVESVILPLCNAAEASMVSGITIYGASSLTEVAGHLNGTDALVPISSSWHHDGAKEVPNDTNLAPRGDSVAPTWHKVGANEVPAGTNLAPRGDSVAPTYDDSFAYIRGQQAAKRALIVAAAGGHNALMSGSPGSGKTLLARSISGLLPALTQSEAIDVAKIHSAAGLLRGPIRTILRPFYAPHHTASAVSVIGGGSLIRPGHVSLAHRGVLFLDEMPEFARNVLEALRQPLEDGIVTVSRASGTLTLPAQFMLIGAMNPCPCGNAGDPNAICSCTPTSISRYIKKISGPLLDRMDIQLLVAREKVLDSEPARIEELESARSLIAHARQAQLERFAGTKLITNSDLGHKNIATYCHLTNSAELLLQDIINRKNLSLRAYHKIQKVARTVADLDRSNDVLDRHIAEALSLRISDKLHLNA